jgi:hypothetical protein
MPDLPRYRCHKEVCALKILDVDLIVEGVHCGSATLTFEPPFLPIRVSENWVAKHDPRPGGYYVVYDDDYKSFSPAAAFEAGYSLL